MWARQFGTVAALLLLGLSSVSDAEYLIYLKGGHFILADDCSLSADHEAEKLQGTDVDLHFVEDCTKGRPKGGRIFWKTINGESGEVSADDVYDIIGTKAHPLINKSGTTMPLEDYLITNRGQSFVNAKTVEQKDVEVYGLKRDELTMIDRRSVIDISPERFARAQSGEGLCPGEAVEFSVSELEIVDGHLLGVVTNLSKGPWRPWIDVEVFVKGTRRGKFQIEDPVVHAPLPNVLAPQESTSIDQQAPARLLKELERIKDTEADVRVCYRKIKTGAEASTR